MTTILPHMEFLVKLRAAVVANASALLTSVRKASLHAPELLSVRQAWSKVDHSSWQGQLRAAPTFDLVTALSLAHDKAKAPMLWPTPQEEHCLLYTSPSPRDS